MSLSVCALLCLVKSHSLEFYIRMVTLGVIAEQAWSIALPVMKNILEFDCKTKLN